MPKGLHYLAVRALAAVLALAAVRAVAAVRVVAASPLAASQAPMLGGWLNRRLPWSGIAPRFNEMPARRIALPTDSFAPVGVVGDNPPAI